MALRIATFNVENLDDAPDQKPSIAARVAVMQPQLARLRADVLCLQEVHSEPDAQGDRALAGLDALVAGTMYAAYDRATTTTVEGDLYVERNLVVLAHPDLSIDHASVRSIRGADGPQPSYQRATADPADTEADVVRWERPILHVPIDLGGGRTLHVFNLHLKSKIATTIPGQKLDNFTWRTPSAWAEGSFISALKRVGQALQVRLIVDDLFDAEGEDTLIAVVGDFNSDNDDVPLRAICGYVEDTGNFDHVPRVMVPCEHNIPKSLRYSLWHLGRGEMFDHVLASRSLFGAFDHAEVHNETLPDESGAFRTDLKFPESDHAPIVAEFALA